MASENYTVSLYENAVPAFAEVELDRLYQNIFSSMSQFRLRQSLEGIHTYVIEEGDTLLHVLLFRCEGRKIKVLNEGITLTQKELDRFCHHVFSAFPSAQVVTFHAVEAKMEQSALPSQRYACSEDIVLPLPGTVQDYQARLGKSTRSYINRYLNKLKRELPEMKYEMYLDAAIQEQHVRDIIHLNRARMAGKNKTSSLDDKEAERILALVRMGGLVGVMTLNGRICAGIINYRVGRNYFLEVVAHDSAYNDYRLGTLCCYMTICQCIGQGGHEYHFLWGRYEYKYRLLGVHKDLDHLAIYRSRTALLRHAGMALQNIRDGYTRRARFWLLEKAKKQDNANALCTCAFHLVQGLKNARQLASRVLSASEALVSKRAALD